MSTEFFNDQWRIPSNENQNKVSNYSMEFDRASSSVINIANNSIFDLGSSFSISGWFNFTGNNIYQALISFDGSTRGWFFGQPGSFNRSLILVVSGSSYILKTSYTTTNQWDNFVITYNGTNLVFYINGSQESTQAVTINLQTNGNDGQIGNNQFSSGRYFNGKADQVTFFDYALSQDQVTQLGAEGYAFKFIPNDRINVGNDSSLSPTSQLSVSAWVNNTGTGTGTFPCIISNVSSSANNGGFVLVKNLNKWKFYLDTTGSSGWATVESNGTVVSNSWQHLCVTWDGSTVIMYLNGQAQTTTASASQIVYNADTETIIGEYAASFFQGELSNVAVFNTALPATGSDSISTLYNNGKPLPDMSSFTSLQGWWKLDDTAIFNTTSTEWSVDNNALPSAYNSSLDFDGGNDYIDISSSAATTFNNLSFSGWLNWDGSQYSSVFSFSPINDFDTANGFVVEVRTGGEVRVGYAGQSWGVIVSSAITASTWTHIAVTLSATGGVILYKNGVSIGTNTATPGAPIYKTAFIGARAYGSTPPPLGGQYFGGTLSNIALWNTALTAPQITTLYNNGTPEATISHSPIAWYKLNNLTTGIQDSVGSNNGTNNGAIEYAGFVNVSAGDSVGMDASSLVASNIDGELISNPMALSPKPIAYYQLGDQSVSTGPSSDYLVPNNSLSDYVFKRTSNVFPPLETITSNINYTGTPAIPSPFTVSFWMKDSAGFNAGSVFFDHDASAYNSTSPKGAFVYFSSGKVIIYLASGYWRFYNLPSGVILSDNEWRNIVVYMDPNNNGLGKVWIDGTPLTLSNASSSGGANDFTAGFRFYLNNFGSNVMYFKNYEIDNSGATLLYNNGSPLSSTSTLAQAPDNWWKLNASEIFNNTSTEWSVDNNAYPSVYRSSLDFSNDYINCGNDSSLSISGDLTISAWVNIDANPPGFYGIISKRTSATVRNYEVLINGSGKVGIYVANGGVASSTVFDSVIPINNWVSIVITIQSGVTNGTKLFLNGSQDAITGTQSISADSANFLIGARGPASSPSSYTNGKISNVSIFNTALSTSNVQTLYNNGTPEASISHSPVSWWKLDNTTTGIQDSAGSNNGTNNGATEYAGFINALAGESSGMDSSNLVVSDLQQTSGYSPYALDFDGLDQAIQINNMPAINQLTPFTWSFWIYPTGLNGASGSYEFIYGQGSAIDYFAIKDTRLHFYISGVYETGLNFITTNEWQHVAVTRTIVGSVGTLQLYRNGVPYSGTSNQPQSVGGGTAHIGTWQGGNGFFKGSISNGAIFDVALTDAQMTLLYNKGVPSNLNNFTPKPKNWWQLGSNSSFNTNWTCLDEIGTNNAVSANMTNDDIVDGVGYSANGLGTSSIDIKGDAPYSTANGLSENMDVLDRTTDVPS